MPESSPSARRPTRFFALVVACIVFVALLAYAVTPSGLTLAYAETRFGWSSAVVVEEGDVASLDDWQADLQSHAHLATTRLGMGLAVLATGALVAVTDMRAAVAFPFLAATPAYFAVVPARRLGARLTSIFAWLTLAPLVSIGLLAAVVSILAALWAWQLPDPMVGAIIVTVIAIWPPRRS